MKVILLREVKNVGAADSLMDVSDGFARNFLFPQKLAVTANDAAMKALEERKKIAEEKRQSELAAFREIASKVNGTQIDIAMDAGESGKLFGSVTNADIARKIHEQLGIDIDKKKIVLDEPIKACGSFNVAIKFGHEVNAGLKLNVSAASK